MSHRVNPKNSAQGNSQPAGPRKTHKVLNVRFLVVTLGTFAVLGTAAYLWRAYQVRRTASALTELAESVAEKKDFTAAAGYYSRYLELRPDNATARLRRAELFEESTGGRGAFDRAIELYQEALRPSSQGLSPEKELQARRRLTELLLKTRQSKTLAAAQTEAEKLGELEKKELAKTPGEWRAPG